MTKRLWLVNSALWTLFWVWLFWNYWTGSYGPSFQEWLYEFAFAIAPWWIGPGLIAMYRIVRYGEIRRPQRIRAYWRD